MIWSDVLVIPITAAIAAFLGIALGAVGVLSWRRRAAVAVVEPTGIAAAASARETTVTGPEDRPAAAPAVGNEPGDGAVTNTIDRRAARYRRFFDHAPLGVIVTDEELAIVEWNRIAASFFSDDSLLAVGRSFENLISDSDRARVMERLGHVAGRAPGPPVAIEAPLSTQLPALIVARRIVDGANSESAILVQVLDQSERRAMELQFAQGQRMQAVGQLSGGIAHDFNNLLTAMIGYTDLLLLRHKPGDPSFGDIMQIKQNANRAANLVRQLLAFSRQQTLNPRIHNLTDILAELADLLRRLIGENIELKMIHGRDLGPVRVDQGQFEQVIVNLVVNARDAMHEGGTLTIRTFEADAYSVRRAVHGQDSSEEVASGPYVAVMVSDTGVGISEHNLNRIFEPFFSTKAVGSGTGLGLSTVYGIVRQTGGHIVVDSTRGQGTTFTIYLPVQGEEANAPTAKAAEPPAGPRDLTGSARILLVEDEDPVRTFSARALRNKGYEVLEARDSAEAMELLSQGTEPDLLITDVIMPGVDGPELIRRVRHDHPRLKFICMSGYAEDMLTDSDLRDMPFLEKPFTLQQLATLVRDVLDDRR